MEQEPPDQNIGNQGCASREGLGGSYLAKWLDKHVQVEYHDGDDLRGKLAEVNRIGVMIYGYDGSLTFVPWTSVHYMFEKQGVTDEDIARLAAQAAEIERLAKR